MWWCRIPKSNQKSTELVLAPGIWGIRLCKPLPSSCRNSSCSFSDLANITLNWDYEDLCVPAMPWMCHVLVARWAEGPLQNLLQPGLAELHLLLLPSSSSLLNKGREHICSKNNLMKMRRRGRMNGLFLAEPSPFSAQNHEAVLTLPGGMGWRQCRGSW